MRPPSSQRLERRSSPLAALAVLQREHVSTEHPSRSRDGATPGPGTLLDSASETVGPERHAGSGGKPPWPQRIRPALGMLASAGLAGAMILVVDVFAFAKPATGAALAWGAAMRSAFVPVVALALIVVAVAPVLRTAPARALLLPRGARLPHHMARLISVLFGVLLVELVAWPFEQRSPGTRRGALAIGASLALFSAMVLRAPLVRLADRALSHLPARLRGTWTWLGLLSLVVVALVLGALATAPEFLAALPWQLPSAAALVAGAAGLGARLRGRGLLVVAALCVVAWSPAAAGLVTPLPAGAEHALRRRAVLTPLLRRHTRPAASAPVPEGVRACRPGETLTQPADVGHAPEDAPDILFITVDAWRWDHTSMGDATGDLTPRLAEHAESAAVFSRAYTPAPTTRHAFRSIFTGLLPGQIARPSTPGLPWAMSLLPGHPTMAAYLKAGGYETVAFVSKPKAFPEQHHALTGFDEIDDSPAPFHLERAYSASYTISRMLGRLAAPPSPGSPPRFVWAHLIEPHFPFVSGPELPMPARLSRHGRHEHSLRYVDQQLDRLLTFALGPERRAHTWVVLSADHGEAFGEHRNTAHGATVYEEEIHVPLIVWGPDVRPGLRTTPVSLVDVLPTLTEVAGIQDIEGLCGASLLPGLRSGAEPPARPVYVAALPDETRDYFEIAWLRGDEKLIVEGSSGALELYALDADPSEQHDLITAAGPGDAPPGAESVLALRRFYEERDLDPAAHGLRE